jgi:hypothetical protein
MQSVELGGGYRPFPGNSLNRKILRDYFHPAGCIDNVHNGTSLASIRVAIP